MYLLSTSALLLSLKVPIFSVLIHTLRTGAYLQNTAQFDRDPDFIGNSAGGSATPAAPAAPTSAAPAVQAAQLNVPYKQQYNAAEKNAYAYQPDLNLQGYPGYNGF